MKANDIFNSAALLLGIPDTEFLGYDAQVLKSRALNAINQICADLCGAEPLDSIYDEINLSTSAAAAAPYGVAMLLTLSEADGEKHGAFCSIYNGLRAVAKAKKTAVRDVLPSVGV